MQEGDSTPTSLQDFPAICGRRRQALSREVVSASNSVMKTLRNPGRVECVMAGNFWVQCKICGCSAEVDLHRWRLM